MTESVQHIYISPHLDDAVCSCGGLIHQQVRRGEKVLVVTLFSAGIESPQELPPYLRALHLLWGFNQTDPFTLRRDEDIKALGLLGAEYQHTDWRGALYRQDQEGHYLYSGLSYFGPPVHEDIRLLAKIRRLLLDLRQTHPEAIFYAPLGVGGHVDHRLAHQAARRIPGPMRFYEDVPYVFLGKVSPFIMNALSTLSRFGIRREFSGGKHTNALISAIQSRTTLFSGPQITLFANRAPFTDWYDMLYPIDLEAKFEAVLQYSTQIPMLFGSNNWAWQSLENYATSIQPEAKNPLERQWTIAPR